VKSQNNSCRKAQIVLEAQPLDSEYARTSNRLAKKSSNEEEPLQRLDPFSH
jgi:hypothetical protein